jgi:hypothetical protein
MSKKSKAPKKNLAKPVKARDLKPAWLDKPRPAAPEPASHIEAYPDATPEEQRFRRAIDLSDGMMWFQDSLADVDEEIEILIGMGREDPFWKEPGSETLIRGAERELAAEIEREQWQRSEMPGGFLILTPDDLSVRELASDPIEAPLFLLEPEASTPLSADLRALALSEAPEEMRQALLKDFADIRDEHYMAGWRGPYPKDSVSPEAQGV